MRKIKQGKCEYDYVELMACPSGCTNGGGQIKLKEINAHFVKNEKSEFKDNAALLEQVDKFQHEDVPPEIENMEEIWAYIKNNTEFQVEFKAIPKENVLNLKW